MEQATALKTVRTFSSQTSAESAPTTASSWVNLVDEGGNHFGKARAFFGVPTLGNADNTVTIQIWGREGTKIFPIKQATMDTSSDTFDAIDLGVCPPAWSFYATVPVAVGGTTPEVSMVVYVQRYMDD